MQEEGWVCGLSRTESGDLLAVLDQLDTDTLPNGGVGLLGLDTDLLEDDALGVGGATEGRGLERSAQGTLLVTVISPSLLAAGVAQLARGVETSRLALSHFDLLLMNDRWLVSCASLVWLLGIDVYEISWSVAVGRLASCSNAGLVRCREKIVGRN